MKALVYILLLLISGCVFHDDLKARPQESLSINPIVHASVMFNYGGVIVYVDPSNYQGSADFSKMFKADLILITHHHFDHFDPRTINLLLKEDTIIVGPRRILNSITYAKAMKNGDVLEVAGVKIEAVPAYNLRENKGFEYHPKGRDNGYVLSFGSTQVYIAGDTECVPELKARRGIDIAFVPIDGVDTMTPEEAAACVRTFKPKVVYPYHQGGSDPDLFASLLRGEGIEVRVLRLP
jgi:L-ascorbate metabolism protein UlaG (beta-lactamase superfamily)